MDAEAAAKHAEIELRYRWAAKAARDGRRKRRFSLAARRINELEAIFSARYDRILPDDDAGHDDLELMAHHLARAGRSLEGWIRSWAPWMEPGDIGALIERVMANPLRFRADTVAHRVRLTEAERSRLGITTIGSVDMTVAERKQARKLRRRQRDRDRRRARGAKPRASYLEANRISRTKPWIAEGVSRRTWYYRRSRLEQRVHRDPSGDGLPERSRDET